MEFCLSAQDDLPDSLYYFSGYTLYSVDSVVIPFVHVLNLNKGTGTVSNIDGSFELMVRDRDTLKFSCIGMRNHFICINALLLRPDLMVFLEPDTIMMEEVRVSPLPPRRFFKYVFLETRLPMKKMPDLNLSLMLGSDPGNIPPTGIRFKGPVQMLYDAFNKSARLEKKLRRNRNKYSKYLRPEVGDSLVWLLK